MLCQWYLLNKNLVMRCCCLLGSKVPKEKISIGAVKRVEVAQGFMHKYMKRELHQYVNPRILHLHENIAQNYSYSQKMNYKIGEFMSTYNQNIYIQVVGHT